MAFSSSIFTAPPILKKISKGNLSSPLSSSASKISPKIKTSRIKFIRPSSSTIKPEEIYKESSINDTLVETNRILVEIQKQLALDFAMRIVDEKEKNKTLKKEKSKEKLRLKEGAIESVRNIGGAIKKTVGGLLKPVKGIFDKIMDFLSILGTGIAANAVFTWLSDEENKNKLMGWFDFIKEHWKWGLAALGGIALLNIVGPISAVLSVISTAVGLLVKGIPLLTGLLLNPLFLKALLAVAIGAATYKAGEALFNMTRNNVTGGKAFSQAHSVLDAKLKDAGIGINVHGKAYNLGSKAEEPGYYVEEKGRKELVYKVLEERKKLRNLKSEMNEEQKIELAKVNLNAKTYGDSNTPYPEGMTERQVNQMIQDKIEKKYNERVTSLILPNFNKIKELQGRAMGGPVSAKTPYLVGESGPEIFAPNVDGSIINNMRTEKIYQMISSKGAGKINFITMELPPKVMKKEQPVSDQQTAPPVPSISPVNGSNPYMNTTPEIYGIYV